MTNTTFTFDNFLESNTNETGTFYKVGNMNILMDGNTKIKYVRIDRNSIDKIQEEFLIRNGFRKATNFVVNFSYDNDSFEKAKEIALKATFGGILTLESGITFNKEAKDVFAKHQKFIMRKHNNRMVFFDAITKNAFWQTSPIKDIGKCQNGYMWFTTQSGHKYQITTINQ